MHKDNGKGFCYFFVVFYSEENVMFFRLIYVLLLCWPGMVNGKGMVDFIQDKQLLKALNVKSFEFKALDGGFTSAQLCLITSESGKQYVLKTLKPKATIERRKEQVLAQCFAAERGMAPKVEYIDPEWRFFVMTYIKGRTLKRSDLQNKLLLQKIANLLKQLHTQQTPFYRLRPQVSRVKKHYARAVSKGVVFPSMYASLLNTYFEESKHWLCKDDLVWCHGDLNPGNILLTDAGDIYLIDWEAASLEHPYAELGYFALINGLSFAQQTTFLKAYLNTPAVDEELVYLDDAMRRVSFVTAAVWFDFSENTKDKELSPSVREKRLNALLYDKNLITGLEYIAMEKAVNPIKGNVKAIRLYALGFLKTYINWEAKK